MQLLQDIKKIQDLQEQGVNIFFTIDAGANVKIFSDKSEIIKKYFSEIEIEKVL